MVGFAPSSSLAVPVDVLKVALPIGVGLISAAYLAYKTMYNDGYSTDRSIPTVPLRKGDKTHDIEYFTNPDKFLIHCEKTYGPVFNVSIMGQKVTLVSGGMAREVFMTDDFSFGDAIDDLTGLRALTLSVIKSNQDPDSRVIHEVIRDNVSPNLVEFTPRLVDQMTKVIDDSLGHCEGKLVEDPLTIFQTMVATAMVDVFMGAEIARNPKVIETFITSTYDFGKLLNQGRKKAWQVFTNRAKHGVLSPLHKHVRVLVEAATPIVLERRRLEKEAREKGEPYEGPLDVMQKFLDNFDKYGFLDLEDICGHLLVLVLSSVHTTSDTSANLCYYLAAYPEYIEPLLQEQNEVLDAVTKERQLERQQKLDSGEVASERDFEGTALDPKDDRFFSAEAVKRMEKMDSFLREIFRFRVERVSLQHKARKDVRLSNGMVITKGTCAMINMRSVHQDPETQGEDPTEFRPWRFLGTKKSATKPSAEFLIFGMGRHACPGRFLAVQELKTLASMLVSRYSKIEIQDPSKTMQSLLSRLGDPLHTGLIFTSRSAVEVESLAVEVESPATV
ncbi:cytochrome P450 [Dissophora ornata]|nr:hypothetical protein BGZ58_005967 [Dissophora ornata]KAI8600007.1 cytochrome P450 [Dissophora ornata]